VTGQAPSVYWPCAVPGVEPLVLAGEVVVRVFLEVAVADHGAQREDSFGALKSPAGSGDL
jgi:hypothetical protein